MHHQGAVMEALGRRASGELQQHGSRTARGRVRLDYRIPPAA
jgi:predicted membrane GTPase involved in stress response